MTQNREILLVDDDADVCETLKDILEMENYEVRVANNGYEAIEAMQEGRFDAVLMDIVMPGINGVETLKRLKEFSPLTPVIMVTAHAVNELIDEAIREGAYTALKKPVDFDRLFSIINSATDTSGRVLIIDDDRELCEVIRELITDRGYRAEVASNSQDAIQLASETRFDALILDLKMPGLNGYDIFKNIKEIRPDTEAVIITAYKDEMRDLVQKTIDRGARDCLAKPFDFDRLMTLVNNIVTK